MTTGEFREVDHDLLADWVGGALDDTPEQAVVARLVADEPAWAEAYALLAPAVADVQADLAAWGAPAVTMPADVHDRLSAALVRAADHGAGPVPTQPLGGRRPAGVPRPEQEWSTRTGPGRRRRRWTRLAGPAALVTASLAVVGLGLGLQKIQGSGDDAGTAGMAQLDSAAGGFRTVGPPQRSDLDYTTEALASPSTAPVRTFGSGIPTKPSDQGPQNERPQSSASLGRLDDPAALDTCLATIAAEHGTAPLVIDVVDYARFRGESALVVRFTDAAGTRWSWVSGPECGIPGSGSDERFRTRVG